jgi:hypothetical protein
LLQGKIGMSPRYSGIRLPAAGKRVGSALPGIGPVVWACMAHASSLGSLFAGQTGNGFTAVCDIDTFVKLTMTLPGDLLLIACTTAESFYCNPSHPLDFLNRFSEQLMGYFNNRELSPWIESVFAFHGLDMTGPKINKC